MPITKSAKKELRKSKRRQASNSKAKTTIKRLIKDTLASAQEKKDKETNRLFQMATKAIDKATKHNIFNKKTAARKKSRLVAAIKRTPKQ